MSEPQVIGVIPARWNSRRFPGKPLAEISGKSLIQMTYENTCRSRSLNKVIVATDDERIFRHVLAFGGCVEMTSPDCHVGTDRVWEVAERSYPEAEIIVNVQGDEPCIDPGVIDQLVEKHREKTDAVLTTPVAVITDPHDIFAPTAVKCVFDENGRALYFSRAPIPFPKNTDKIHTYYRHLGVYCFERSFLKRYHEMSPSRLQDVEDLEQLKVLERGFPIHVCVVKDEGIGIDTPEDLEKLRKKLCQSQENTFSLPAVSSPL